VVSVNDGWGRLIIREVRVVWVPWWMSSVLFVVGGLCIPSSWICCLMASIPSFFQLGIFLFLLRSVRLDWAPFLDLSCMAARAAFMASVQYRWVSKWDEVSLIKLTSRRNLQFSGTLSGRSSKSSVISLMRSSDCLVRRYPWRLSCKDMLR
jgi:hypothetical protein